MELPNIIKNQCFRDFSNLYTNIYQVFQFNRWHVVKDTKLLQLKFGGENIKKKKNDVNKLPSLRGRSDVSFSITNVNFDGKNRYLSQTFA